MSAVRGFAVGTLTLIGLEVLGRNPDVANGALTWAHRLFVSFLSSDTPALHFRGNWAPAGEASTSGSGLSPAHATVVQGLAPKVSSGTRST